ncbi:uncharacterized protein [Miscanthus floridulus]|uniref:uncharacterized protein n=1 Tax=Miscanthus floridulus TaxID=154761 RepID=UPI003457BC31
MPTGETLAEATPSPEPPPTLTRTATASSSPASTHRHRPRRHRTFSSSSSSSSHSTVSSAASSPSPSPRGRGSTTSTTSVPFSWEHHPGIPKMRLTPASTPSSSSAPTPLPLPPPLRAPTTTSRPRHHHHARRRHTSGKPRPPADDSADPFAAALAECTRERGGGTGSDDAGLMDALFPTRAPPAPTTRRWSSTSGVVGLLDLYGCKSAMGMGGVAEGAFVVRRPVAVVRAVPAGRAGPGRAGRR